MSQKHVVAEEAVLQLRLMPAQMMINDHTCLLFPMGAAEAEAKAQAGAAEAEAQAQADAGAYEARLHQLQADLQQREQQVADTQRLQYLQQQLQDLQQDELQRKEQQVAEQQQQLQQQQADMHLREQQLADQQHQVQQREQQVAQQQHQLQQQQADMQQREHIRRGDVRVDLDYATVQSWFVCPCKVGAKPSLTCLQRQCAACKDRKVGVKAEREGVQLQYRQFKKLDNGQGVELATVQTTLGELVVGLNDLMQKQLWHHYLAKHQRATFRTHCAAVRNTPGLVVVSCDWSEKLTIHQDIACQGAYWKQRTMSVFVACAHYQDMAGNYREESVFVSADKCDQSAEASTTALVQVIECLLQGRRHPDDGWVGKMDMRQLCLCGRPTHSEDGPFHPPDAHLWLRLRVAYLGSVWRIRCLGPAAAHQTQSLAHRVAQGVIFTLSSAVQRDWYRVGRDIRVGLGGAVPSTWFKGRDPRLDERKFASLWPAASGGWFQRQQGELVVRLSLQWPVPAPPILGAGIKAALEDIASLLAQHWWELCLAKPETETPCDTRWASYTTAAALVLRIWRLAGEAVARVVEGQRERSPPWAVTLSGSKDTDLLLKICVVAVVGQPSWEAANEVVQHAERMLQQQQEGQQQKRTGQRLPMCDPRVWDAHGTWEKHGKQIRAMAKDHALSEQADKRAFQFDPVTQMGMGLDPGAIQAGSAALGMWDEDGCLESFHSSKLTRSQVQHDSGLIQARRSTQLWNDNIKLELQHLAAATPAGTSQVAIQRNVAFTLATWDAVWGEYLHPKWAERRMRLYGAQREGPGALLQEGLKAGSGQVQHRLLRSALSKRFEAPLDQATHGDTGKWVDRDCNAALNIQRASGRLQWRPLELCRWQHRGAAPAKGKEYPALGFKKLRDRAPKAQAQQPVAQ
ncbi:hypothetical protein QJQ45_000892 [Haematococcus lacustris]|nr:hypothetical protein QJQ45_000892 [Haematococcus lacustris]